MKLTQWLVIVDGTKADFGSNGKLYYREIETGFIPEPGVDDIVLWNSIDDDDGSEWDGPMWHIKRRYMDNNGGWHIELTKMVIDPDDYWMNRMKNRTAISPIIYETSWWANIDGDPIPNLERAGWRKR